MVKAMPWFGITLAFLVYPMELFRKAILDMSSSRSRASIIINQPAGKILVFITSASRECSDEPADLSRLAINKILPENCDAKNS